MNEKARERFFAVLLLLGLAGLFFARLPFPSSPGAREQPTRPAPAVPLGTQLTATRVVGRVHGEKEWEFRAKRILRSLDGLLITATGVEEGLVFDEGKPAWSFSAGYLRYYVLTRRLEAGEGVTGRSTAGDLVFRAPRVVGDLSRKQLLVEGPVEVEGSEVTLRADNLEYDLTAETVILKGRAEVSWSGGKVKGEEIRYTVKDGSFSVLGAQEGVEIIL
ncbi:MAG: LptA/OstA family protein [Bacillota bacterium]